MALIEQSPAKRFELKKGNLMSSNSASNDTINEGLMVLGLGLRLRSPFRLLVTVTCKELRDDKRHLF